jgi:hypothetical protein
MPIETCQKRALVFQAGTGTQTIPPGGGEFLGFQKITPQGAYVWFCVDGLLKEFYPAGWLAVYDRTGKEIEKNIEAASGAGMSLGFNPFFGIDSPLPFWLWLLILGIGLYTLTKD